MIVDETTHGSHYAGSGPAASLRSVSPLKVAVWVVGWPAGILAIVAGIAIYVGAGSVVAEAVGAILVLIGVALVVALIRCRILRSDWLENGSPSSSWGRFAEHYRPVA